MKCNIFFIIFKLMFIFTKHPQGSADQLICTSLCSAKWVPVWVLECLFCSIILLAHTVSCSCLSTCCTPQTSFIVQEQAVITTFSSGCTLCSCATSIILKWRHLSCMLTCCVCVRCVNSVEHMQSWIQAATHCRTQLQRKQCALRSRLLLRSAWVAFC